MVKKNTLLTLDSELVKTAKEKNLNISEIAEVALKNYLEKLEEEFDPKEYIQYLIRYDHAIYTSPFEIKSIKLSDVGPIKALDTDFAKNNVIIGPNASGKTILLGAIADCFYRYPEQAYSYSSCEGQIDVKLTKESGVISLKYKKQEKKKDPPYLRCLMMDNNEINMLTPKHFKILIDYLKRMDAQIILTSLTPLKLESFKVIKIK